MSHIMTHYLDSELTSDCSYSFILRRSIKYKLYYLCLTRPELKLTRYRTRGEHANHCTTDVVCNEG
jgi:hypothetical protein